MVTGCTEKAKWLCFDGTFWIKVCGKDRVEFRQFTQDNNLPYKEKEARNSSQQ